MVGLSITPTREEGSRGPCGYDGATPLLHDRLDQAQQTRMDGMNGIDGAREIATAEERDNRPRMAHEIGMVLPPDRQPAGGDQSPSGRPGIRYRP